MITCAHAWFYINIHTHIYIYIDILYICFS